MVTLCVASGSTNAVMIEVRQNKNSDTDAVVIYCYSTSCRRIERKMNEIKKLANHN